MSAVHDAARASAADLLVRAIADPLRPPADPPAAIVRAVERHGLAPLACECLARAGQLAAWPAAVQIALRRASAAQALLCRIRDAEVRRVLEAVGETGTAAVLIKGAALAYTHYSRPYLRPRTDTDLVIRHADRTRVCELLRALGYAPSRAVDGRFVTQQAQWTRVLEAGMTHALDVHWRLFNPHAFGDVLPVDALLTRAVPVPALGASARAASTPDALLLACVHRVAHHAGDDDPIWAYDIRLLLESLDADEAEAFVECVRRAAVEAVVADGVDVARRRFRAHVPARLETLLRAPRADEATAAFLRRGRRQVDDLASDLAALPRWRDRLRLVREHLFPPAAYMSARYALPTPALLPLAYVHRIAAGAPRWLRRKADAYLLS